MYYQFNGTTQISPTERIYAGVTLLMISCLGLIINSYIASGFMFGIKFRGGFFIYCTSKNVGNVIICSMCLFWLTPSVFANSNLIATSLNMVFSQITLFGLYIQGVLTQCFLSVNRFATICFSGVSRRKNVDLIVFGIITTWFAATVWSFLGFPECTGTFESATLTYSYTDNCHISNFQLQLYCAFVLLMVQNLLNSISFLIIACGGSKSVTLSCRHNSKRKQRNARLFLQVCLQSFLYVFDAILVSSLHRQSFAEILIALPSTAFVATMDG